MAGPLTKGSLNFGKDHRLEIMIGGQAFIINNLITKTKYKVLGKMHEELPTNNDGYPVRRGSYEGYEVDITMSRQNGTIDSLMIALQQNYFSSDPAPDVTLTRTVRNPSGTVDRHIFKNGVFDPSNMEMGTFSHADATNDVTLKILFNDAQDVSGGAPVLLNVAAQKS